MKTLIVGLGNPILGDDGVGWKVAEKVELQLTLLSPITPAWLGEGNQVDVDCVSLGGISLMERLIGYDYAILIDAFASDEAVGSIRVMKLSDLPNYSAFHISSIHDTSLQNAIELGRALGAYLPEEIMVIGIATQRICDFSEELSPLVVDAIPQAMQIVLSLLEQTVIAG